MKFTKPNSEIYVYDNTEESAAFMRTTHLAVAAHQDDVEFMAYHGILECFGHKDKGFSAVIVTNGSGSPRAGVYKYHSDEEMIEVRKREQKKAAFVGEYSSLSMLMHPSAEVKDSNNRDVAGDILKILNAAKPGVVYTHNLADKHDTHVAVALRVISAIRSMSKADRPKKVYGCEVWRALDWLDDGRKIKLDVGQKQNLSNALMGVFDSQISGGKQYDAATTGRRLANATYADDHAVDTFTHVTYAMDLTPLIEDDSLDIKAYIEQFIEEFKGDVIQRLGRFGL